MGLDLELTRGCILALGPLDWLITRDAENAMSPSELWSGFWTALLDAEAAVVRQVPKSAGLFVGCVLIYFVFVAVRQKDFSPRRILRRAFPKQLYSGPRFRVDLFNWSVWTTLVGPLGAAAGTLLGVAAGAGLSEMLTHWLGPRPPLLTATWAIVAIQAAAPFWAQEFADFGMHYLGHRLPWLWSLHRAHHSTEVLTYFAGARAHPIERFTFGIPVTVIAPGIASGVTLYLTGTQLLPQTAEVLGFVYLFFGFSSQILSHSHAPISYGWFNAVIGGPIMHQLHHSAEARHRDRNFGTNTLIFDWIFGTLYLPKRGETWTYGLNEQELGEHNPHQTLRDLYLEPLSHLWRQIRGHAR